MQNGFVRGNQVIPILDNQFLPVFGAIAVPSDILMEEMGVGNNPGIESDFEFVVGKHPLILFGDIRFPYRELVWERPGKNTLPGRSRRVLRGNGVF